MDKQDRRIHLLENLRKLDYQIIEQNSEPQIVDKLKQERDQLRYELNSVLPKMAA